MRTDRKEHPHATCCDDQEFSSSIIQAYARRARHIDRMILACFVLGLSTRKVAKALLSVLGMAVSPATISRVARTLDGAVAAFHRRPLQD